MAWNISGLGGTATSQGKDGNPQITGALEALDHRGQVAGSKGLGRIHVDEEAVRRQVLVMCLQCLPGEHLFKCCPRWRRQQKTLWTEVRRETGRGKDRLKIWDLFAGERCSQATLDFLATTDVGRLAPKQAEDDAPNEAPE